MSEHQHEKWQIRWGVDHPYCAACGAPALVYVYVQLAGMTRRLRGYIVTWKDTDVPDTPVKVKLEDGGNGAVVWVPTGQVFEEEA